MACLSNSCTSRHSGLYQQRANEVKSGKTVRKIVIPKRVVASKKITPAESKKVKSSSTSKIDSPKTVRAKKTTQSDQGFANKVLKQPPVDYCKECGDCASRTKLAPKSGNVEVQSQKQSQCTSKIAKSAVKPTKPVQNRIKPLCQYYKNENFGKSDSIPSLNIRNKTTSNLDTIKEASERHTEKETNSSSNRNTSDSEEVCFHDVQDNNNFERLKEFRRNNFFECHSAKSRIESTTSATSLVNHKCFYRFYLNDRLFPAPLSTDNNGNIRCVECHLPLDFNNNLDTVNGTIQAKVKINDEESDITLLLPVTEPLIIKERRKLCCKEEDVLYFGLIKLNQYGNSMFKRSLPEDSLALRYQKGYQEHKSWDDYNYECVKECDIILI